MIIDDDNIRNIIFLLSELDEYSQMVEDFFSAMMKGREAEYTPAWMRYLFNTEANNNIQSAMNETERITSYFEHLIKEHEKTFDEDNIRDFLDLCLQQGLQNKSYRHIAHVCIAFMADATITSVVMMMFTLLYLIHYPEYQIEMRKEINAVLEDTVGGITLEKRDKMPFSNAFINEVFRIVTPALTSVPNQPQESTNLGGYFIPKHFQIMVNIYGLHNDPNVFENPTTFNPYRFLENGKVKNINEFIPFGIGM